LPDEAFAAVARNLAAKPEPEQRALLRLLSEHKDKRNRWKTWKKKKPELAAAIEAVRQKLNAEADWLKGIGDSGGTPLPLCRQPEQGLIGRKAVRGQKVRGEFSRFLGLSRRRSWRRIQSMPRQIRRQTATSSMVYAS
jgi:hypothetical protein